MPMKRLLDRLFGPQHRQENLLAIALFVLVVLLIVVTTDASPPFIYQGF
jgi:hypothetical protein